MAGRAAFENVTFIDTVTFTSIGMVISDDCPGAPLVLYIGDKNVKRDRSFLDRTAWQRALFKSERPPTGTPRQRSLGTPRSLAPVFWGNRYL